MMKNKNLISMIISLIILVIVGLGCQMLKPKVVETSSNSNVNSESKKDTSGSIVSLDAKPDFTMTAEEYYKMKKEWGDTKDKKIQSEKWTEMNSKFANGKIVEITGRIQSKLETTASSSKPTDDRKHSIILNGGVGFNFIICYLDDADKAEFENLKKDQSITIKGMVSNYPNMNHTRLIKAN